MESGRDRVAGSAENARVRSNQVLVGSADPAPEAPEHGSSGTGAASRWYVVQTKSRQEKALALDLEKRRIHFFLPLVNAVRYYGKRKFRVQIPLFPGYMFLRGTVEQTYACDRTDRVARVIKVEDQARLDEELRQIRTALARDAPLQPCPAMRGGTPVEVTSGPFRGIRGIVDHSVRRDRLILQVDLIGRAALLEIDRSLLRPMT